MYCSAIFFNILLKKRHILYLALSLDQMPQVLSIQMDSDTKAGHWLTASSFQLLYYILWVV